jgi:sugar phosphate isomerase/epimerase
MSCAIVGYTGFVGSNLLQFYKYDYFYNSKNFHEASNKSFDTMFFCGIPAVKWYANKYPEEDFKTINVIKNILKTITVKKFILISTIDVYEISNCKLNEDYDCDFNLNNTYGSNRYLFELFVKQTFSNYNIIRLPALFGKGLKKNIIYDLINNNNIENISLNTEFQWYDLNWLKNDIDTILKHDLKICNLFTEPIKTFEIIKLFNYPIESFTTNSNLTYNVKTKYSNLFNVKDYIRSAEYTLHNIKIFIEEQSIDKSKLVVSNICIKHISNFQFACILKLFGIKYVQIAPTTLINNWDNIKHINFEDYTNNGIYVYSFQSITFGLQNHNIFDDNTQNLLFEHIKKVIDIAIHYNIKVLVFGCPKNRKILELNNETNSNSNSNNEIFINFFRKLGDYIGKNNLTICIENNSKDYGCNYLNTIKEVGNIVRKIDHTNIKMMVDVGNSIMENDNLDDMNQFKDIIGNIDISNTNMEPLNKANNYINKFIDILNTNVYTNKINLEMLIKEECPEKELQMLFKSLNNFIKLN